MYRRKDKLCEKASAADIERKVRSWQGWFSKNYAEYACENVTSFALGLAWCFTPYFQKS